MNQFDKQVNFWAHMLDESDIDSNANEFKIVKVQDADEIVKYLPSVLDLIKLSYANVEGGFLGQTNPALLKKQISMLQLVFDGERIIAGAMCKRFQESHKVSAMFCDQTPAGKRAFQAVIRENIKDFKNWVWCEVSGAPEHYYKKFGGYPIPNCFAEEILKKTGLVLNSDGFHYSREIGDSRGQKEKVIFGFSSQELFEKVTKQADYAMRRDLFNSGGPSLVESKYAPDLEKASTFIIQLSDLYDEGRISELTPSLSAEFDTAISVMEKYKNDYKWVRDELDYAKDLRLFVPTMEIGRVL